MTRRSSFRGPVKPEPQVPPDTDLDARAGILAVKFHGARNTGEENGFSQHRQQLAEWAVLILPA
jgi:hypothetical protein